MTEYNIKPSESKWRKVANPSVAPSSSPSIIPTPEVTTANTVSALILGKKNTTTTENVGASKASKSPKSSKTPKADKIIKTGKTNQPSSYPSSISSHVPTNQTYSPTPSELPSKAPQADNSTVVPTGKPSIAPTTGPVSSPTTNHETNQPTTTLASNPSKSPAKSPTATPTKSESNNNPSKSPTTSPTSLPTGTQSNGDPTIDPSADPSKPPTNIPTSAPTKSESNGNPTTDPSTDPPTKSPTKTPTSAPTKSDSNGNPTTDSTSKSPTNIPTSAPTKSDSNGNPTTDPSTDPPSKSPTKTPTTPPTTSQSSSAPTDAPTTETSTIPTSNSNNGGANPDKQIVTLPDGINGIASLCTTTQTDPNELTSNLIGAQISFKYEIKFIEGSKMNTLLDAVEQGMHNVLVNGLLDCSGTSSQRHRRLEGQSTVTIGYNNSKIQSFLLGISTLPLDSVSNTLCYLSETNVGEACAIVNGAYTLMLDSEIESDTNNINLLRGAQADFMKDSYSDGLFSSLHPNITKFSLLELLEEVLEKKKASGEAFPEEQTVTLTTDKNTADQNNGRFTTSVLFVISFTGLCSAFAALIIYFKYIRTQRPVESNSINDSASISDPIGQEIFVLDVDADTTKAIS